MKLDKLKLSINLLLIIECCKEKPSEDKISYYAKKVKDWNTFLYQVGTHGVLPLVYKSLKILKKTFIPLDILSSLKDNYFKIAKDNILLSSELIKITKLFDLNNIKYINFKGASLSYSVYGDITLRQYCDLDILVELKDKFKINELLKNIGYENEYLFLKKTGYENINVITFFNKDLGTTIEIHFELISKSYAINLYDINLFKETNILNLKNNDIKVFNKEFLFIYLCLHGSKHIYERVSWICDINKLLIDKTINWELVIKYAKSINIERTVLSSIYLASITFETKLPNILTININKDKKISSIANNILVSISTNNKMSFNSLNILLSQRKGIYNKLNLLFKSVFQVKDTDFELISFPKYLHFLYFIIRPFRLIFKQFSQKRL